MPGLITLVARHDGAQNDVHVDVIGTKAIDDDEPLPRDAIFRIASLTKPIAAAAAMILVEDGVLELSGAVDEFLPELADRRVLRRLDGPLDDTVPAKRAITVDDLLTFRMGFGTDHGPARHVPDPDRRAGVATRHARPAVATDATHPGRVDPAFRVAPADAPAGRAVDVQHRVDRCSASCWNAPPASPSKRSCANGCSSRSACATPGSACRPTNAAA